MRILWSEQHVLQVRRVGVPLPRTIRHKDAVALRASLITSFASRIFVRFAQQTRPPAITDGNGLLY